MHMYSFFMACPYAMIVKKCNVIFMCFAVSVEVSFGDHVSFHFIKLKCAKG
jgi:hypothetical protein